MSEHVALQLVDDGAGKQKQSNCSHPTAAVAIDDLSEKFGGLSHGTQPRYKRLVLERSVPIGILLLYTMFGGVYIIHVIICIKGYVYENISRNQQVFE